MRDKIKRIKKKICNPDNPPTKVAQVKIYINPEQSQTILILLFNA